MGIRIAAIIGITILGCTGCASLWFESGGASKGASLWFDSNGASRGASSSLVNYLYNDNEHPPATTARSSLRTPLRVGLAFVPTNNSVPGLDATDKQELLLRVERAFAARDYIEDIVIIPDTYMMPVSGSSGLDQIGRLYQLDVISLVSYDQAVDLSDRKSSFFYWTIVGAYLVKGNHSQVSTFVDMAVIDVTNNKLLLRAAGVSGSEQNTTLVDAASDTVDARRLGFELAMNEMVINFERELSAFEKSVNSRADIEFVHSSAKGAIGLEWFLLFGCFVFRCSSVRI